MTIESLFVYPVKSLAGIALQSAIITPRGLENDRNFMLTTSDYRFITQRTHPRLTSFSVELDETLIRVSHPEAGSVEFPAEPPATGTLAAVVWDDTVAVSNVSRQADQFFSDALGESIHLVGMPAASHRQVDPVYAKEGDAVSFADGYPVLVLGSASIDELNSRTTEPVPINRFRANVIVGGSQAWEEDSWTEVRIGEAQLNLVKQCARCIVIRTDQNTGERMTEPIPTLSSYRKVGSKIMVGMNAIPVGAGSIIHVGQRVDVRPGG
jgi:uncharacterized protein YcbX